MQCFLFNDLLLLTKKGRLKKQIYVYVSHSHLNKILVKEMPENGKITEKE
jgi:hypothetical protein